VDAGLLEQRVADCLPSPRLCEFVALDLECAIAQAFAGAAVSGPARRPAAVDRIEEICRAHGGRSALAP
jgi:hypothetical protein